MTRTAVATDDHGRHVRSAVVASSNVDIRDIVHIYLDGMDIACHRAEDGERAVVLCREHKPQVLLLDMCAPGMTALDVIRAIRADQALAQVRVILLTAGADLGLVDEALAAGAETYLIMPVGPGELSEMFSGRQRGP